MKLETEDIQQLLIKYSKGECTEAEKASLESWYLKFEDKTNDLSPDRIEEIVSQALQNIPGGGKQAIHHKLWIGMGAIAASIALVFGIWFHFDKPETITAIPYCAQDIAPGGNHATLTLANGKVINLSNAKTGVIIDANKLSYSDGTSIPNATRSLGMQMITTPKGGQYQVVLSDGTRVWLNATTTLKFPQSFSNSVNRKIEICGEAYLEVAKDKAHPFVVKSAEQIIEVLGTHFNINNYADEPVTKTTLLEGSVKVSSLLGVKRSKAILKPGEQSQLNNDEILITEVNAKEAVAWKNGKFIFKDESLGSIMRKLSRWYNVDVIYQDINPEETFWGSVSRSENVSKVLEKLELTGGVHFTIDGRKIYVSR